MKAVVLTKPTKAENIVLSDVEVPKVKSGWVLVKIKAFGLNHSEQILREFEIENDYINKPIIPGIECVGEIADPSDSGLAVGQKVVALMGGMGRSFNGSYAEYALLPIHHVFPVESELSWKEMGAIPETYFTAWGSLFQCLR
ncbi:MAG: alcohol dehydrogenase catalytic domain-containing protein, partial [Ruminococcus sp.]|nr:alcohol dehydrogenase catalytic domain-containing protein [Ruminococcus sp.]